MIGLPSVAWRSFLPRRRDAAVRIEVEPQTFDAECTRVHRVLLWSWTRVVPRRFVVRAVSLRELLTVYEKLQSLGAAMHGLAPREALYVALGDRDVLRLDHARAREIWNAWRETNRLAIGDGSGKASSSDDRQSVLDLVFDLERAPFNYSEERVLDMSAPEAIARVARFLEVTRPRNNDPMSLEEEIERVRSQRREVRAQETARG